MRSLQLPAAFLALLLPLAPVLAETGDAPPIDAASLLKELHRIRDQQSASSKQTRQTALQQINAAASSPERGLLMWEEAVRAVQFDGQAKEGAAFREWKEREGEALSAPLGRNAIRLFFMYLGLTIQRDAGAKVKELLPQLLTYTRELANDEIAVEALEEAIKREKEQTPGPKRAQQAQRKVTDEQVRKAHDQVLRRGLGNSPVVQWMKLGDFIDPEKWEKQPGNLDGIYTQVILPELRVENDARVTEYWDHRLKREGETAMRTKLAFEVEKFNTQRRPALLWSRAQDLLAIGQKNRAATEMFGIIRSNPTNPELPNWIAALEAVLVPPAPVSASDAPSVPAGEQVVPPVVK